MASLVLRFLIALVPLTVLSLSYLAPLHISYIAFAYLRDNFPKLPALAQEAKAVDIKCAAQISYLEEAWK